MVDIMHDTHSACDGRGEQLVAYMYGEDSPGERAEFELHLARCSRCRQAMSGLNAVRGELAEWTPPVPADSFFADRVVAARTSAAWLSFKDVPRWAQAMAALLVIGVAAGIANLEVRYGRDGFVIRTGWSAIDPPAKPVTAASLMPAVMSDLEAAKPWQADLTGLRDGLRQELEGASGLRSQPADEAALLRRVREIVEASESRQRRELALRIAEVVQEGQVQRRVDLQRIDRSLGIIESSSRANQIRYTEAINNLAVRVGMSGRE
jgi:hypothetical protein